MDMITEIGQFWAGAGREYVLLAQLVFSHSFLMGCEVIYSVDIPGRM